MDSESSEGFVYIVTNEAMPEFVKIGITYKRDVSIRVRELHTTSVPLEFQCFHASRVSDARRVEGLLHDAFADQRVHPRREFFRIEPERVRSALLLAELENVTPGLDEVVPDESEQQAIRNVALARRRTSLTDIGLMPGDTLHLDRDHTITCTVVDEWNVEFEGERMTPSASALKALHGLGYEWPTANGWQHWTVDGQKLRDRVSEHLGIE